MPGMSILNVHISTESVGLILILPQLQLDIRWHAMCQVNMRGNEVLMPSCVHVCMNEVLQTAVERAQARSC